MPHVLKIFASFSYRPWIIWCDIFRMKYITKSNSPLAKPSTCYLDFCSHSVLVYEDRQLDIMKRYNASSYDNCFFFLRSLQWMSVRSLSCMSFYCVPSTVTLLPLLRTHLCPRPFFYLLFELSWIDFINVIRWLWRAQHHATDWCH